MIVLGIILVVVAYLLGIPILYTLGVLLLVVGVVLLILGSLGHPIGRRHYF